MTILINELPGSVRDEMEELVDELSSGERIPTNRLTAYLGHRSASVRKFAIELLEFQNDPVALRDLLKLAGDSDIEVSLTLGEVLSSFRHPDADRYLIEGLKSVDTEIRLAAVSALRDRRHLPAAPDLVVALGDEEPEVRREAVTALGHLRDHRLVPAIRSALSDGSASVRRAAIAALSLGSEPPPTTDLRQTANDPDWLVRRETASILGRFPTGVSEHLLIGLLQDAVWQVVREALLSLEKISSGGFEAAVYLSRHRVPEIRIAAAEALGNAAKSESFEHLTRLSEDPEIGVRSAAKRALRGISNDRRTTVRS